MKVNNSLLYIKRKLIVSLLFIIFLVSFFILSLFIESVYPFVGFVLITLTFLTIDLNNLFYTLYLKGLELENHDKKYLNYIPLIWFISFVFIIFVGLLMNLPLSVYEKQISQISLLAGLFFIINEFWDIFVLSMTVKSKKQDSKKNVTRLNGVIIGDVLNIVIHLFVLLFIAWKLGVPDNMLSIIFLVLVFAGFIYYGLRKLRESVS